MRFYIYIILLLICSHSASAQVKCCGSPKLEVRIDSTGNILSVGTIMNYNPSSCKIHFDFKVNGKPLVLNDSVYENEFGEKYKISKLKYYVSNLHFISWGNEGSDKNVFLVDASKENTFAISMPVNPVTGIEFLVGVDSAMNCSGAQSGALDPLNDMFWTWNNGYVMFKLEGVSESSNADQNRIEHHIGGFKGEYKTMRLIKSVYKEPRTDLREITVSLNLDEYWNSINKIRISEKPVITIPGEDAKKSADNFPEMFVIRTLTSLDYK